MIRGASSSSNITGVDTSGIKHSIEQLDAHGLNTNACSTFVEQLELLIKEYKGDRLQKNKEFLSNILGISVNQISEIFEDIIEQSYLFEQLVPGKQVEMTSKQLLLRRHQLYVVKKDDYELQAILKINGGAQPQYFQINIPKIRAWNPIELMKDRCKVLRNRLETHTLPHLDAILDLPLGLSKCLETVLTQPNAEFSLSSITSTTNFLINQKFFCRIIKTEEQEYHLLGKTNDPDEPWIQLDCLEKSVWVRRNQFYMEQAAAKMLDRILEARSRLSPQKAKNSIAKLINKKDLLEILDFCLTSQDFQRQLTSGISFRIAKENSGLKRTINVIRAENGEYMLMLETKSKRSNHKKHSQGVIGEGTYGVVKPAWRIDGIQPIEWVNKVSTDRDSEQDIFNAKFESNFSQHANSIHQTINITLTGQAFCKKNHIKISQYSERALGDLQQMLITKKIAFTEKDLQRITYNILDGIHDLHRAGKYHQDLKPSNIFIYKDRNGYYAKISDFGNSADRASQFHQFHAVASSDFASPEIFAAYHQFGTRYHHYYYSGQSEENTEAYPYGYHCLNAYLDKHKYFAQSSILSHSHPANDMWALGLLIFYLHHGFKPNYSTQEHRNWINSFPLAAKLLEVDRTKRWTACEALSYFKQTYSITACIPPKAHCSQDQEKSSTEDIAEDTSSTAITPLYAHYQRKRKTKSPTRKASNGSPSKKRRLD